MIRRPSRFRLTLAALTTGLLLAVGTAASASADEIADMLEIDQDLGTATSAYVEAITDENAGPGELAAAARTLQAEVESARSDFERVAEQSTDDDIADFAREFADEAGQMAEASENVADAADSGDDAAVTNGQSDLQAAGDAYAQTASEYNEFLASQPAEPKAVAPVATVWIVILVIAVVFLVLALLLALGSRSAKDPAPLPTGDPQKDGRTPSLSRMRWTIVAWAGVFVVGAVIPLVQVAFATPDANGVFSYRVFWYPLVGGALFSIVAAVRYFMTAKKLREMSS